MLHSCVDLAKLTQKNLNIMKNFILKDLDLFTLLGLMKNLIIKACSFIINWDRNPKYKILLSNLIIYICIIIKHAYIDKKKRNERYVILFLVQFYLKGDR